MISVVVRIRRGRTPSDALRLISEAAANRIRPFPKLNQEGLVGVRGSSEFMHTLSEACGGGKDCMKERDGDMIVDPHRKMGIRSIYSSSLGCAGPFAVEGWPKSGRRFRYMSTAAVKASEPGTIDGILITDSCVKRMKEIQLEDGPEGHKKMLRLSVDGGGCSGFLYSFTLDDKQNADDRSFEKDGVKIVVDEISLSLVKGSTVDFSEELIRASFTVSANPNAAGGCGCGASFTAK